MILQEHEMHVARRACEKLCVLCVKEPNGYI
jgi:hypothetical protein